MNEREQALDILGRVDREGAFASPLIEALAIAPRERQLVRALVLGVLRWRSLLDTWIVELTSRPLKKLDRSTIEVLRLGLFQVAFTEIESHAAVNETVKLAARRAARAKGMVNAVLRQALRNGVRPESVDASSVASLARTTAHPEWMVARWADRFGLTRAAAICQANQQYSFPDLLVNGAKISVDDAEELLRNRGYAVRRGRFVPEMLTLDAGTADIRDEVSSGVVYPMDEGSALVASLVSRDAGVVLDAAAAPGGKSLVLSMQGRRVISNDISMARLQTLRRSSALFSARNPIIVSDGGALPLTRSVDAVLLDAPCSATGTIRRNPEIKWRLRESDLAKFAALQLRMLTEAMRVAQREVVYSTCSLEAEENDAVVAEALGNEPAFERVSVNDAVIVSESVADWIDADVLRLTPESGCDGFTVHKLRRKAP